METMQVIIKQLVAMPAKKRAAFYAAALANEYYELCTLLKKLKLI